MKIRTDELFGAHLDRAVNMALGFIYVRGTPPTEFSSCWKCATAIWRRAPDDGRWCCMKCFEDKAPTLEFILEHAKMDVMHVKARKTWIARIDRRSEELPPISMHGPTVRLAAFRCFVAARFGHEIDLLTN